MTRARAIGIWISGVMASAIFGGLIGMKLESGYGADGGFFGAIGGALAFTCFRLWVSSKS